MFAQIPMPVLYGVFLYMGIASLDGLQFFDRIFLFFMPKKYQPDYSYLRQVGDSCITTVFHQFPNYKACCVAVL